MNLAIITLTTIACLYACFAYFVIRNGKWHYLLIHPYVITLAEAILFYRYKTTFVGMEFTVDLCVALELLVFSFFYWIGYNSTSFQKIKGLGGRKINFPGVKNNEDWNSRAMFFGLCTFCLFSCCLILFYRIMVTDSLDKALFASYYTAKNQNPILPVRIVGHFLQLFNPFFRITMSLLFVWPFIKQTRINLLLYQFVGFSLIVISACVTFGDGSRQLIVQPCFIVCLITVIMLSNGLSISKRIILFFFPYFIIVLLFIFMMPSVRMTGFAGIKKIFTGNVIHNIQYGMVKTSYSSISSQREFNKNNIEEDIVKKNFKKQEQELISINNLDLSSNNQTEIKMNGKDISIQPRVSEEFLHKFYFSLHVDVIAWSMNYYGVYSDYLGMSRFFTSFIAVFIPKEFFPEGKPLGPCKQIPKDHGGFDGSHNNPAGPFNEGYVYYGYVGGFISCIIWGMFTGKIIKIAIDLIESTTQNCFNHCILGLLIIYSMLWVGVGETTQVIPWLIRALITYIVFKIIITVIRSISKAKSNLLAGN